MPTRSIVIAIALATGLFGLLAAGCNNGKRTARAPRATRSARGQELASARSARPAEVLAATAHRTESSVQLVRTSVTGSRIAEPLPEPIVLASAPQSAAQQQFRPVPAAPAAPALRSYQAAPAAPRASTVPGPELAMAQAGLAPMAAPAIRQGYRVQRLPVAPIPELEPVRFRRMPEVLTTRRPAAEVMMTASGAAGDLRHALAPLGNEAAQPGRDWVPTPTTAMLR